MGGCASKNKHPKEEAYKPVNAPSAQPDFEEIVPESKPAVNNKPPIKLNGTVLDGDKRVNRNSLVGPGGVILPNQPEVKDELDPSIPYIDASEDELDEESSPARAKPTLTADVETTVDTSPGVKVPDVPQVSEVVDTVSREVEEVKAEASQEVKNAIPEVRGAIPEVVVADTIKAVEVHQTEAAKPEVNIETPAICDLTKAEVNVPKPEVDIEVKEVQNEIKDVPNFEVNEASNIEVKAVPDLMVRDMPDLEAKDISNLEANSLNLDVNDVVKDVSNFEVKAKVTNVPKVEVTDESSMEVKEIPDVEINGLDTNGTGDSLVDEVMRGVGSGFLSKDSYPIDVDAVTETAGNEADKAEAKMEEVKQEASDASASALTSGQDWLGDQKDKVQDGLQNGFAEVEDLKGEFNDVTVPVVDEGKGFDVDKDFDALINSNDQSNFVDIDDSAEKKLTSRGLNILTRGSLSPDLDPDKKVKATQSNDWTEEFEDFAGFRLAKDEETDVAASPELIQQTTNSVGFVFSPYVMGAGFRVGDKCIMTAYHLIREMLDKMAAQGIGSPEQQLMDNKDIWIQFEYIHLGEYLVDNETRFRFKSIRYTNPQLDIAILELEEHEDKTLPVPLVNFCGIGKRHKVEFVSHDPSPLKRQELVPLALQPTIKEIQKAGEWCQNQGFPPRGYDGVKDMSKMRFQCAYRKNSCGSPGVVMCEDEVYVVALLTKGYPSFYLDVDERSQQEIPMEFKLVETSSMTDVYLDMKNDESLSELCNNIFGFTVSKQQS